MPPQSRGCRQILLNISRRCYTVRSAPLATPTPTEEDWQQQYLPSRFIPRSSRARNKWHSSQPLRPISLADPSPSLPLFTRERSFLLGRLHHALSTSSPTEVWQALAAILQYPSLVPTLPAASAPTSSKQSQDRKPIVLSLPELRSCLGALLYSDPPTREGLKRVLIVVELIGTHEISGSTSERLARETRLPLIVGQREDGRGARLDEVRGGGIGLRDKDWDRLARYASKVYRAPRKTHEVAAVSSLFSQYLRNRSTRSVEGGERAASVNMLNTVMRAAGRARDWELVGMIEERLQNEEVKPNFETWRIRFEIEEARGASPEKLWNLWRNGIESFAIRRESNENVERARVAWNTLIGVMGRKDCLEEAKRVYKAMRKGKLVDIQTLSGQRDADQSQQELILAPPSPDLSTYTALIQSLSHVGDLKSSLQILDEMMSPSTRNNRLSKIEPTIPIYISLFKGFATHGTPPADLSPATTLDPLLLSGQSLSSNTKSLTHSPYLQPLQQKRQVDPELWNLAALGRVFRMFLTLRPPPRLMSDHGSSTMDSERTAPSSKQLFWLVLAFEKLSGWNSELVLQVWQQVEDQFGPKGQVYSKERYGRRVWTGWRVDSRLQKQLMAHKLRLEQDREGRLDF